MHLNPQYELTKRETFELFYSRLKVSYFILSRRNLFTLESRPAIDDRAVTDAITDDLALLENPRDIDELPDRLVAFIAELTVDPLSRKSLGFELKKSRRCKWIFKVGATVSARESEQKYKETPSMLTCIRAAIISTQFARNVIPADSSSDAPERRFLPVDPSAASLVGAITVEDDFPVDFLLSELPTIMTRIPRKIILHPSLIVVQDIVTSSSCTLHVFTCNPECPRSSFSISVSKSKLNNFTSPVSDSTLSCCNNKEKRFMKTKRYNQRVHD
jgi:hypothetical protein